MPKRKSAKLPINIGTPTNAPINNTPVFKPCVPIK